MYSSIKKILDLDKWNGCNNARKSASWGSQLEAIKSEKSLVSLIEVVTNVASKSINWSLPVIDDKIIYNPIQFFIRYERYLQ